MFHKQELSWDERTVHATWVPENFKTHKWVARKAQFYYYNYAYIYQRSFIFSIVLHGEKQMYEKQQKRFLLNLMEECT